MAGILLGGLLTLIPTILQTAVQITQIANPTTFEFNPNDYAIIHSKLEHLKFKMTLLSKFLGLDTRIKWITMPEIIHDGTIKIPSEMIKNLYDNVRVISENYESYLAEKVMPIVVAEYYSTNVKEMSDIKLDIDELVCLHGFPMEIIEGSIHHNKLQHIDQYVKNYHISTNPSLAVIVNRLIDDSILALSRIAPGRIVCPTSNFCIIPQNTKIWNVDNDPLKAYSVEYFQGGLKIKVFIRSELYAMVQKMKTFYNYKLIVKFKKSVEHKLGLWGGKARTHVEVSSTSYPMDNDEAHIDYTEPSLDQYNSVELDFQLIGELISGDILAERVARLHNLSISDFTFGRLLSSGDYEINNPIFGVNSIIQNTIGSAQHSIQLSITLLVAWLSSIMNTDASKSQSIKKRYITLMSVICLEDFCSIGGRILNERKLKACSISSLELFWERLIMDLMFMKQNIMRTKSSKNIVNAVISL